MDRGDNYDDKEGYYAHRIGDILNERYKVARASAPRRSASRAGGAFDALDAAPPLGPQRRGDRVICAHCTLLGRLLAALARACSRRLFDAWCAPRPSPAVVRSRDEMTAWHRWLASRVVVVC